VSQFDTPGRTDSGQQWRRSSRCQANGTCVEIAELATRRIAARDAKQGQTGPLVAFSDVEWRSFITNVKNGAFDLGR
jgi:uncharacterized protein DUF397